MFNLNKDVSDLQKNVLIIYSSRERAARKIARKIRLYFNCTLHMLLVINIDFNCPQMGK